MTYILNPYSILLGPEGEHHRCGGLKVRFCGYFHKDAVATAEGNIFEIEQGSVLFRSSVISWVEEEEVGNNDNIAFRLEDGVTWRIGNA